ncbi:MAG: hypothetical protein J6Z14_03295 [Prevotella sp.]|nr:hypothetical protein [Prevotella sp.]
MKRRLLLLIIAFLPLIAFGAKKQFTNAEEAKQIFDKVYQMVFGPQGARLHYDVNIIGIYKTSGTITYKGKKQQFSDERVDTWNDGITAYMAYRKKKTVEIHRADSDKKDKYSGKFKFHPEDFTYSMERADSEITLKLKQNKDAKGTIKEVRATLDAATLTPKHLKVKVAFFWTNVYISNFRSGGITDNTFVFPRSKYVNAGFKFVDKR